VSDEAVGNGEITGVDDYRATARRWLERNLELRSAATDSGPVRGGNADIDSQRSLQAVLFAAGYAGIDWPTRYGGQGLTAEHRKAFDAEAARYALPDLGVAGATTMLVCGPIVVMHGTERFKQAHVPLMLSGDELWVQYFSEPAAGSDLAGILTRADRVDDRWILNGAKTWTSGGADADYGLCLARTNWDVPKHKGLTWFAVPTSAPGVSVRPIREISGRAEFCEEFLDNVELTDDDVVGEIDGGWSVTRDMLTLERSVGSIESRQRWMGGRQLAPDLLETARRSGTMHEPHIVQLLAQAQVLDFVRQQLEVHIQRTSRRGGPDLSAYHKLAAGIYEPQRARIGIDIGGERTVVWHRGDSVGAHAALAYLDGRIMSIAGGSNEMQRNIIGERILGLPREPASDTTLPFSDVLRAAHQRADR